MIVSLACRLVSGCTGHSNATSAPLITPNDCSQHIAVQPDFCRTVTPHVPYLVGREVCVLTQNVVVVALLSCAGTTRSRTTCSLTATGPSSWSWRPGSRCGGVIGF